MGPTRMGQKFNWGPMGPNGTPWAPMGPHGAPMRPMGPQLCKTSAASVPNYQKFAKIGSGLNSDPPKKSWLRSAP